MKLALSAAALAAALSFPVAAQSLLPGGMIPIPANSAQNTGSAVVGITVPAPTPNAMVTPGAVGSYATAPDAPVSMIAWNSRQGYHWTTTEVVYQDGGGLYSAGGPASIQVPVGACVYGMGNNNPSWAAKDIQCPAGSGWLTVAYKTIYNSYAGY